MSGAKIIEGLKDAAAGKFEYVTINGVRWSVVPGWQPIETAPKDGTEILVSDSRCLDGFMQVVCWDDDRPDNYSWATSDGPSFHADAFTHWMPLPEPPGDDK